MNSLGQLSRSSHQRFWYSRKPVQGQSGQAITEYILLLVVILALGGALLYRLSTPLQRWVWHYAGEYIDCLLDQGELPVIGGVNGVQNCSYTPTEGDREGSADGSGSSQAGEGEQERSSRREGANTAQRNRDLAPGSGGSNAYGRQRIRQFRLRGPEGTDALGSQANQQGRDIKVSEVAEDGEGLGAGQKKQDESGLIQGSKNRATSLSSRRNFRRTRIKEIRGKLLEDSAQTNTRSRDRVSRRIPAKVSEAEGGGFISVRPKKFSTELKRPKVVDDQMGISFSFGKIFRIGFIMIFLVVILWVVGSQLAQVQKNME